ncbi:uncharacterized protein LOC143688455 isoform X3 [Tamandua tetradactyla]|uniref:uncharacterized protein LOC143688455 isoform X3 n=1 Tax=Tamandua tetradactyla TaxID=48850 RepID=UPI0040542472
MSLQREPGPPAGFPTITADDSDQTILDVAQESFCSVCRPCSRLKHAEVCFCNLLSMLPYSCLRELLSSDVMTKFSRVHFYLHETMSPRSTSWSFTRTSCTSWPCTVRSSGEEYEASMAHVDKFVKTATGGVEIIQSSSRNHEGDQRDSVPHPGTADYLGEPAPEVL